LLSVGKAVTAGFAGQIELLAKPRLIGVQTEVAATGQRDSQSRRSQSAFAIKSDTHPNVPVNSRTKLRRKRQFVF
jgi:hypothetical protein